MKAAIKIVLFVIIATIVILIITEVVLRLQGYVPGVFEKEYSFLITDSFYVRDDLYTDESGILKVSPSTARFINESIAAKERTEQELYDLVKKNYDLDPYIEDMIADFISFNIKDNYHGELNDDLVDASGEFKDFITTLSNTSKENLSEVDSAYLQYAQHPINSEGFRSIEFKDYTTKQKKILLLGDSYAWGLGAVPITNSFADILAARGYVVFNTGIPATDPAQYLACAQKYIPKLCPDIVIINICMANDQMRYKRIAKQDEPAMHVTSLGWFDSSPNGCYLDPFQCYELSASTVGILNSDRSLMAKICRKTVLTTFLWNVVPHEVEYTTEMCQGPPRLERPITEFYVSEIEKVCKIYNSRMLLVLIPWKGDLPLNTSASEGFRKDAEENFPHVKYYLPRRLMPEHYHGHFNNEGYKVYADFLQALVDSSTNEL